MKKDQTNESNLFPSFIPKSHEIEIQTASELLERYRGRFFVITEKIDGMSCTFYYNNGHFGVCSKDSELKENEENILWKLAKKHDVENKLAQKGNFAIYGVILGGESRYGNKDQEFLTHSVYDIDNSVYLKHNDAFTFCLEIGLHTVPVITAFKLNHTIDDLIDIATTKSMLADTQAEGIVCRAFSETNDPEIGRLSFQVLNPDFDQILSSDHKSNTSM